MSEFEGKLSKALDIYRDMQMIVTICKEYRGHKDMYELLWDDFWELSRDFPFDVEWCDMDTSYEEDISARYNAIHEFMEGFRIDLGDEQ